MPASAASDPSSGKVRKVLSKAFAGATSLAAACFLCEGDCFRSSSSSKIVSWVSTSFYSSILALGGVAAPGVGALSSSLPVGIVPKACTPFRLFALLKLACFSNCPPAGLLNKSNYASDLIYAAFGCWFDILYFYSAN